LFGGLILTQVIHYVFPLEYRQKPLTIEQMATILNVPLPNDAINLQSNGLTHGLPEELEAVLWFQMNFQASSDSVFDFTNHLCNYKLFRHFDPFDAVHVASGDYKYGIIISTAFIPYFAYSPSASDSIYGNRCSIEHGTVDVRVDNSLEKIGTVLVEYYSSKCPWPCLHSQLDLKPFLDFPLLVRGMEAKGNKYFLNGKFCLDIDPAAYSLNGDRWLGLLMADVSIKVDNKEIESAYISGNGNLLPAYYKDTKHNLPSKSYFNYCYSEDWKPISHLLAMQIKTVDNKYLNYSLPFQIE
jgi:hypothetical protein